MDRDEKSFQNPYCPPAGLLSSVGVKVLVGRGRCGACEASRADGEAMRGCARAVRVGMRAGMVSSSVFRRLEPLW